MYYYIYVLYPIALPIKYHATIIYALLAIVITVFLLSNFVDR